MKIKKKTLSFDLESTEGVAGYNVYYDKVEANYDSAKVKFTNIIPDQLTYSVVFPDQVPITEGQYQIGVSTFDAEGNESDIIIINYFFDFTAPRAPKNLRIS